jgi:hypothetical protein
MAVVISDFEVVVEPPPAPPPTESEFGAEAESAVLRPTEVEMLLERQAERAARVRAH